MLERWYLAGRRPHSKGKRLSLAEQAQADVQ
jgi:hypothetical protein